MRTFIAIDPSEDAKTYIQRILDKLKSSQADVKWAKPQDCHLTLKFIGEIDEKTAGKTEAILEDIARGFSPFTAALAGLGAFPGIEAPRIIWIGIKDDQLILKKFSGLLEERLAPLGIPVESRQFTAHITLGRLRSSLNQKKLTSLLVSSNDAPANNIIFRVDRVILYKSTLTPTGPVYEPLKAVTLKTS